MAILLFLRIMNVPRWLEGFSKLVTRFSVVVLEILKSQITETSMSNVLRIISKTWMMFWFGMHLITTVLML